MSVPHAGSMMSRFEHRATEGASCTDDSSACYRGVFISLLDVPAVSRSWSGSRLRRSASSACWGAGSANVPDEMRARRFVVVDQTGIVRAEIRTEPDGSTVLRVSDASGAPRAVLSVSGDGLTRLVFQGRAGAARASLTVAPEDWPALVLFDKQGRRRFALDVGLGGWPFLAMRDEQGEDRAVLELTPQGAPQLLFFARGGTLLWRAP